MPKVRMKKTTKGSPNGVTIEEYEAGQEYMLGSGLTRAFVEELKVAEIVGECKAVAAAPANKAIATAPENKVILKDEVKEEKGFMSRRKKRTDVNK